MPNEEFDTYFTYVNNLAWGSCGYFAVAMAVSSCSMVSTVLQCTRVRKQLPGTMAAANMGLHLCMQLASLPGCVHEDILQDFGLSPGYWAHLSLEDQLLATWPMRRRLVDSVRRALLACWECAPLATIHAFRDQTFNDKTAQRQTPNRAVARMDAFRMKGQRDTDRKAGSVHDFVEVLASAPLELLSLVYRCHRKVRVGEEPPKRMFHLWFDNMEHSRWKSEIRKAFPTVTGQDKFEAALRGPRGEELVHLVLDAFQDLMLRKPGKVLVQRDSMHAPYEVQLASAPLGAFSRCQGQSIRRHCQ